MELPDRTEAKSWEGHTVVDRDEAVLGTCRGVFADTDTGVTEWLDVDVQGHTRSFVPALDATEVGGRVRVGFLREQVLSAPKVGDSEQLSKRDEMRLYDHYGVEYTASDSDSLLPSDVDVSDTETTAATASTQSLAKGGSTEVTEPVVAPAAVTQPVAVTPAVAVTGAPVEAAALVDADEAPRAVLDATPEEAAPFVEPSADSVQQQAATPVPVPIVVPPPAPENSSSAVPAGAGVAAGLAALVGAVALGLKARDRRAAKRRAPAARADLLKARLQERAALAARVGNQQLAALPGAASRTSRQLSDAASSASVVAAERSKVLRAQLVTASGVAAQRGQQAGLQLAQASDVAARRGQDLKSQLVAASQEAAKRGKEATAEAVERSRQAQADAAKRGKKASAEAAKRRGKAKAKAVKRTKKVKASTADTGDAAKRFALRSGKQVVATASSTSDAAARSSRKVTGTVTAAPKKVAKKGRKARRTVSRSIFQLLTLGTAGAGYVLGARAGEPRYREITGKASQLAQQPQVQQYTQALTDRQQREQVLADLQRQVAALRGRRNGRTPGL